MDYRTVNRLIYEALENIAPIETSKVSMFALDNPRRHPPFLRFRFKNIAKNNDIYKRIKEAIENFQGHLKWKLYTNESTQNYIILASFIQSNNEEQFLYQSEYFISILGKDIYNEKIEQSIIDIPGLAEKIINCH
jgi:hypothetical protein